MKHHGKRALITASSSGIGRGVAEYLAREGAEVFLSGHRIERLAQTAREIQAWSATPVHYQQTDFTQAGSGEALGRAAIEAMGGVDILFANTGGPKMGSFLDLTLNDWEVAYRLILESAIGLTRAVLPCMMEQRWGRLLYLTSNGVLHPLPQLHLSNVLRSAVAALVRSLVSEIGPYGITAHVLAPGSIETERRQHNIHSRARSEGRTPEEIDEREQGQIAVKRLGTVEDVASLAAFLSSNEAGFLTGTTINIDGGMIFMPLL